MIKTNRAIWKETFVEKLKDKHHVTMGEVEEILHGRKKVYRIAKGDVKGEDVYLALEDQRWTVSFGVLHLKKESRCVLPISARDMDSKERRGYGHE